MRLTTSDYLQTLDYVLENTVAERDYADVKKFFCQESSVFPEGDEHFLNMALNKLRLDGYIDFIEFEFNSGRHRLIENAVAGPNMSIRRNFNGHVFARAGGYQGAEFRRMQDLKDKAAYDEKMAKYSERLTTWTEGLTKWTRRLTIATIGVGAVLLLWEVYKFLFEHKIVFYCR